MSEDNDDEARRVSRIYSRYRGSHRKLRAWRSANPGNAAIRAELLQTAFAMASRELCTADAILDAGCGSGWWLKTLAARSDIRADLHGVEILAHRAQLAQERVPGAAVAVADIRQLPYPDARFDLTCLFTVLSSLDGHAAIRTALLEAWRVTTPAGLLLVWEPRLPNPVNPQTTMVSLRALREALRDASIEVRSTTVLPALARRLGSRTELLYPRLARVAPLRTHRLIAVRKPAVGRLAVTNGFRRVTS